MRALTLVLLVLLLVSAPGPGQALTAPPAFEVSTVRHSRTGESGSHSSFDNGRFTASNILLKNLIQYSACGIPEPRIFGGPPWLNSERFDIEAKVDEAVAEQLRTLAREPRRLLSQALFQRLLADRFKLAVHWETHDLPIYALVVARKGATLHPSERPDPTSHTSTSAGQFTGEGLTLAQLAQTMTQELSRELGRVVVDETGIQGKYDVSLKWTPDSGAAPIATQTNGSPTETGPSLFTAVQEQLGLKLEASRGPVQVLVIDHLEMPSEN